MYCLSESSPKVCLITTAHVSFNPRLVKEADALSESGYRVRVVAAQSSESLAKYDRQLLELRKWEHDYVDRIPTGLWSTCRNKIARVKGKGFYSLSHFARTAGIVERGFSPSYSLLLRKALQQQADLFIAHNLEALPVACVAAKRQNARVGFDSEDLHRGEFPDTEFNSFRYRLVNSIESKYLPHCDYVSSPSEFIADELMRLYRIRRPVVIHNTFPWKDRERIDGLRKDRESSKALSLYWFSQTIGLDRGIQDAIEVLALLSDRVELHLRGAVSTQVKQKLLSLAQSAGTAGMIRFHDRVPAQELLSRAAEHDVGLALEQPLTQNHRLTISNKLFLYMLAGVAVAATRVPGQAALLETFPGSGFTYAPGDLSALAKHLQEFIDEPSKLDVAKYESLRAARNRWNWETESQVFLQEINDLIGKPPSAPALEVNAATLSTEISV
jgi:glycosyltransferase involved in cell wall biosynthesis